MSKEDVYFNCFASFRVFGGKVNFEEISDRLRIKPTEAHRMGEEVSKMSKRIYPRDIWLLTADVPRESDLEKHLLWLKKRILLHKNYLFELKKKHTVDIYCSYISNNDQGGFSLSPKCLELFLELDISFKLSILI